MYCRGELALLGSHNKQLLSYMESGYAQWLHGTGEEHARLAEQLRAARARLAELEGELPRGAELVGQYEERVGALRMQLATVNTSVATALTEAARSESRSLLESQVSTRILGRRMAPIPPFLIPNRVSHGFTQDPSTDRAPLPLQAAHAAQLQARDAEMSARFAQSDARLAEIMRDESRSGERPPL